LKQKTLQLEQEKKQAVLQALSERTTETIATYQLLDAATRAHVNTQISEFNRLQSAIRAASRLSAAPRFASGGLVTGPGTETSDSIDAKLSHGEFVVRAKAVDKYGVSNLTRLNSMTLDLPHSGPTSYSYDQRKEINANFHYHGEAARMAASPAMIKWNLRKAA
jgi:hypothetical protein